MTVDTQSSSSQSDLPQTAESVYCMHSNKYSESQALFIVDKKYSTDVIAAESLVSDYYWCHGNEKMMLGLTKNIAGKS